MKLWLLARNGETTYDEHRGFVVSASDEEAARNIVYEFLDKEAYRREQPFWKNGAWSTTCKQIGISIVPEGIILRDFYEA